MDGIMMEEGSSGTAARGIAGQNRTEQTDSHDQTRHGSGGGAGVAQSAEGRLCTGQSGMSVATLAREGHVLRSQDGWMDGAAGVAADCLLPGRVHGSGIPISGAQECSVTGMRAEESRRAHLAGRGNGCAALSPSGVVSRQ